MQSTTQAHFNKIIYLHKAKTFLYKVSINFSVTYIESNADYSPLLID